MLELEAKIIDVDPAQVGAKLEKLGALKAWTRELETRFFKNADGSAGLRVRREGDAWVLNAKVRTDDGKGLAKSAHEYETAVADPEALGKILGVAGFTEVKRLTKRRTRYDLGDAHFEIDEYRGLPPLLEIEAPSQESLVAAAASLGYAESDLKAWNLTQLEAHYGRKAQ